jgi:hypothetical protein
MQTTLATIPVFTVLFAQHICFSNFFVGPGGSVGGGPDGAVVV